MIQSIVRGKLPYLIISCSRSNSLRILIALELICIPTPYENDAGCFSNIVTSWPDVFNIMPAERPPIPAPTIAILNTLKNN